MDNETKEKLEKMLKILNDAATELDWALSYISDEDDIIKGLIVGDVDYVGTILESLGADGEHEIFIPETERDEDETLH